MKARTRAKVDNNQAELVKTLRHLGASVQHVHQISGALDIIIGFAGIDIRAEIKDPDKPPSARKLTPDERRVFDTWRGRKPVILETTDDCIDLLVVLGAERTARAAKIKKAG